MLSWAAVYLSDKESVESERSVIWISVMTLCVSIIHKTTVRRYITTTVMHVYAEVGLRLFHLWKMVSETNLVSDEILNAHQQTGSLEN